MYVLAINFDIDADAWWERYWRASQDDIPDELLALRVADHSHWIHSEGRLARLLAWCRAQPGWEDGALLQYDADPCPTCDGYGKVWNKRWKEDDECKACRGLGVGEVKVPGCVSKGGVVRPVKDDSVRDLPLQPKTRKAA